MCTAKVGPINGFNKHPDSLQWQLLIQHERTRIDQLRKVQCHVRPISFLRALANYSLPSIYRERSITNSRNPVSHSLMRVRNLTFYLGMLFFSRDGTHFGRSVTLINKYNSVRTWIATIHIANLLKGFIFENLFAREAQLSTRSSRDYLAPSSVRALVSGKLYLLIRTY